MAMTVSFQLSRSHCHSEPVLSLPKGAAKNLDQRTSPSRVAEILRRCDRLTPAFAPQNDKWTNLRDPFLRRTSAPRQRNASIHPQLLLVVRLQGRQRAHLEIGRERPLHHLLHELDGDGELRRVAYRLRLLELHQLIVGEAQQPLEHLAVVLAELRRRAAGARLERREARAELLWHGARPPP